MDSEAPEDVIERAREALASAINRTTQAAADFTQTMDRYLSDMDKLTEAEKTNQLERLRQESEFTDEIRNLKERYRTAATDEAREQILIEARKLSELNKQRQKQFDLDDQAEQSLKDLGLVTQFHASKVGKLMTNASGYFQAYGRAIGMALQPQNLFAAGAAQVASATKELFSRFDDAQAQLSQATGTTGEYNQMLYDVQAQNRSFNVDVGKAAESIKELHREMSSFNTMGSEAQATLVTTSAQMQALGVSAQGSAEQFDNMIQGMNMTVNEADNATKEMVALGDSIGVSADIINKDFNAAAAELAKYGEDAIDVFKDMAAAAKATGIEMSALMGIAGQFDTFEGAATAAGKLNSILGGGVVNSMDLLNATEEERIRMLIESIELSGKSYAEMNRFEKQALANAAGISDMTEANKIFGQSLDAYDEMQAKSAEANAESAKLEERAQAATSLADKLNQIGQAFAVAFLPVLEFAHGFMNIILEINDATGGILMPVLVGLVGVIFLLSKAQAINNMVTSVGMGIKAAAALVTGGLSAAQATLAGASTLEGTAAAGASVGTGALAASMAALLVPVVPLVPAIAALGLGMFGLGIAIAAPIIAMVALVMVFADLFKVMMEAPQAIGAAAIGVLAFAAAAGAGLIIMATSFAIAANILAPAMPSMIIAANGLIPFAYALGIATLPILGLAAALYVLGLALQQFANIGFDTLALAAVSLLTFSIMLIKIAPFINLSMGLVGIPLLAFAMGLYMFGVGIQQFNDIGLEQMVMAVVGLLAFAGALMLIAPFIQYPMYMVAIPLIAFALGLLMFGKALQTFNDVSGKAMDAALGALIIFSLGMLLIAPVASVAFALVGIPLMLLGLGLLVFGKSLQQFSDLGEGVAGSVITILGGVLATLLTFGIPLVLLGPQFGWALVGLAAGLVILSLALNSLPSDMTGMVQLSTALSTMASLGIAGAMAISLMAGSVLKLAYAMMFIPEEKAIALGVSMDGYAAAMEAVSNLTPDSVAAADAVVKAAAAYRDIQADMKAPDQDAFVSALKSAIGGGGGKDEGQDIVLVLNNREFGRAVDAAIKKRHNLSID